MSGTASTIAFAPMRSTGREQVHSLDEFNKLLAQRKRAERVPLLVRRRESALYVPVELA